MKKKYIQNTFSSVRGIFLTLVAVLVLLNVNAQTITFENDGDITAAAPYYTYDDLTVDYLAEDYPAGTTFYLVLDTNGNGILDAEDDNEDYVLATSTTADDIFTGEIPNITGAQAFLLVAGEDGSFGEEIADLTGGLDGSTFTVSGTLDADFSFDFDQAATREAETQDYDLTSDNYLTIRVDVDATNVTATNALVFEYSTDNGTTYDPLTDQQGDDEFSAFSGELVFALSQSLNVDAIRFRISQNNSSGLALDVEDWFLNDIEIFEYSGTFIQHTVDALAASPITINAPSFTINTDTYGTYVGEDIDVDYTGNGFTTGATYYLYTGDILDPEDRVIFDINSSISGLFESTWPFDLGGDNVNVNIAGIYGNIDTPETDFADENLNLEGSDESAFSYAFDLAGVRNAVTDSYDLSAEEYVTLIVGLDPNGALSTDNAILVQYSSDGTAWTDMEADSQEDEITADAATEYEYTIPAMALTSSTQFRVRQKSIGLGAGISTWTLSSMRLEFYVVGADQFIDNPFVTNYSIVVSDVQDVDDASVVGQDLFPGDQITVFADVAGFDVDTEDYVVLIENQFLLENVVLDGVTGDPYSIDGVTDEISITGDIPLGIAYGDNWSVQIKTFNGSEPLVELNENVFDDYDVLEDLTIEGAEVEEGDTDVDFFLAGDRSLTTPAFNIASTDELTLQFTLVRNNPVRSPSGTEVVLEYSTDGSSFTEIETFSLNDAGESGETYELDNTTLPAGMVSTGTHLRFRQASNNGLDLDAWNLSGIVLMGGTNIADPVYIDHFGQNIDVLAPQISLTEIDNVNLDIYPSSDIEVEFEIFGDFPAGTTFELLTDVTDETTISFGTVTEGTNDITVPSIVPGTYQLYVAASHDEVESNEVALVVGEILLTNISITSDDAVTDGDDEIVYPGNTVDISYTVEGSYGSSAVANLEIYDEDIDEFLMIVDGEAIDGDISATLPIGIGYEANDAEFRLTLTNGNLTSYLGIDEDWATNTTTSNMYFPNSERQNHQGSNYFYQNGERSAITEPLDFASGGRIDIDIQILNTYYAFDQEIYLQYSTDEGETWVEFASATMDTDNTDFFPDYIDIPSEAWINDLLIRFISNEDELATGTENVIFLTGLAVEQTEEHPVAETTFMLQPDLILEELSVSMSTLTETNFVLDEEFTIEYNAEGPFPADVDFAVVMEQAGEYAVLGESDQTGAVQMNVSIPIIPFGDTDLAYNLSVVPFIKVNDDDVYRGAPEEEVFENEEDIIDIEGRATSGTGSSTDGDYEFEKAGERFLLSRAFDLSTFASATLDFDFTYYDGEFNNFLTLPELQVSTDAGATFTNIPVTEATYEAEGYVYPSGSYSVDIPEEYLTTATHFRWIQQLNLGDNEDVWRVYNISVVKGETNALNDAVYTEFNMPQAINAGPPNLDNYIWEQTDLQDPVFNGESFDYTWDIDPDTDGKPFPDGTVFTFTLMEQDPITARKFIVGENTGLGSFTSNTLTYQDNENQDVYLTAAITVDDEEVIIYDEEWVGSFNVFWQVVETFYTGDADETLFSGDNAQFRYEMVNNSTAADNAVYESLFYNLIIEDAYNGYDYLLAAQQGISTNTFDVQIPPFVRGTDYDFVVKASEGSSMIDVGTFFEEEPSTNIFNGDNPDIWFQNFDEHMDRIGLNHYELNGTQGFRELVSTDQDLSDIHAISFQFNFDMEFEDLEDDQMIDFEYSIDEGANWIQIESFPNEDHEAGEDEKIVWIIPSDAKAQPSRFRIRQDDSYGSLELKKMRLIYIPEFPFETESVNIDVSNQNIQISAFEQNVSCSTDTICLVYEVQGAFGSIAMARVAFETELDGDTYDDETEYIFSLEEGVTTDTLYVVLPRDLFEDEDYIEDAMYEFSNFAFSIDVRDETWDEDPMIDNTFTTFGDESTTRVELVNTILWEEDDLEIYFDDSQSECQPIDILLYVDGQQGFQYQAYDIDSDPASPTLLGDPLIIDYDTDNYMINLGEELNPYNVGVLIQAQSSDGSVTCGSLISEDTDEIVVNPIYELYRDRDGASGSSVYVRVDDLGVDNSEEQCAGENKLNLQVQRIASNQVTGSSTSNVDWYRNDGTSDLLIGSGTTLTEFLVSGTYFGRVTDGDCVYDTRTIDVTVREAPDQPVVTVASGNLIACEGNIDVQLDAPAGFNFYLWSTGETTQSINVDDNGSYTVRVSDISYDLAGCVSVASAPIVVEEISSPEFAVGDDNTTLDPNDRIGDGRVLNGCDGVTVYFFENGTYTNNGIVTIVDNTTLENYASTNANSYTIVESGEYFIEKRNDDLVDACVQVSGVFTVNIEDTPTAVPLLTSVGPLSYCAGEGSVELTAPTGFQNYRWYRDGSLMNNNSDDTDGFNATDNTRTVTDAGIYSVAVGTANNCYSPFSNSIEVVVKSAPSQMSWLTQHDAPCGSGPVEVSLYSGVDPDFSYQLYDRATGLPSGAAVDGTTNNNTILVSDPIDTYTEFYVVSRWADGSATCETFDPDSYISASPNNVVLELDEASLMLEAIISGMDGWVEIRWMRNGIELVNKRNDTYITIADNADYSVEVTFAGGCEIVSSTLELGEAPEDPTGWLPDFAVSSVYPNPVADQLMIEMNGAKGVVDLTITNITGQIVKQMTYDKAFGEDEFGLSLADLQRGVYNLTVIQNGNSQTLRVVKQ